MGPWLGGGAVGGAVTGAGVGVITGEGVTMAACVGAAVGWGGKRIFGRNATAATEARTSAPTGLTQPGMIGRCSMVAGIW